MIDKKFWAYHYHIEEKENTVYLKKIIIHIVEMALIHIFL